MARTAVRVTHLPPLCDRAYRRNCHVSVTELRRLVSIRPQAESAGACSSSSSPTRPRIDGGALALGGHRRVRARRARTGARSSSTTRRRSARGARAYRAAAPDAFVVYGTKAFPNVALLRLLAEEGIGADVSTLGELRFAQAGRHRRRPARRARQQQVRRRARAAAADAGALVVVDSLEEVDRARAAGVSADADPRHAGIEADTHENDPHRPPRLEVRPAARRRARGAPPRARRPRASTSTSARSCCDARRRADGRRLARDLRRPRPRRARLGAAHDRPRRRARRRDRARRAASSRSPSSCAALLAELERACALQRPRRGRASSSSRAARSSRARA